jgi:hypothetical protein
LAIEKFSDGTPAPAKKFQDGTPAPAVTERENQILAMTPEQEIAANPTATQTGPYLAEKARLSAQQSYDKVVSGYRPPKATGRPAVMTAAAKQRLEKENANVASWNKRLAIPIQSYPSLAKAMADAPDLTEADVRRVVNLAAAWTTAQAIESQEIDQGKINILMSLNPVQRGVVIDILSSRASVQQDSIERARRDQRLAEEERATWGPAKQLAAGFDQGLADLGTGFMKTVDTIFEGTLQTAASGASTFFKNKRESGQFLPFQPSLTGDINLVTDLFTQWDEAELGQYDDAVIEQARQKYGNAPVDLILEIKQAQIEGDPDPLMTVSSRYVNDPTRAEYISLLTQRVIDDPEREQQQKDMLALVNRIDSASSSDFGGIVTTNNWFDGQPLDIDNPWRSNTARVGLAKALNVTAAVVLDPTIALSKGVRIAKGVRYGLDKIASTAGAESVQTALTMPEVYGYINNLTDDVAKYISMRSAGQDTAKFGKAIDNRYRAYFDPSVISDLVKANVTTPEAFIQYVQDTNRMAQIARGQIAGMEEVGILTKSQASKQIAEVEGQTVFGRMYGQQGARRSKPLLPGSNIIPTYNITRSISNAIQKIGPTKNREKEVRKLFGDANDPNKSFGMMLNEGAEELGKSARLRVKGGTVSGNVAAAWDKTSRLLSTTPGVEKIYTKDARDTAVFYKFARMHLPKRQAQLLADEWRNGTQAERVLMWIGTVRTATYARGFEDISNMVLRLPDGTKTTVDEYVKTLNVGTRTDVMFSPRSVEVFDGESFVPFDRFAVDYQDVTGLPLNVGNVGNDIVRTSPSDFNGIEHPLHLWQTSDYLAVPNMNELQRITKRNRLINHIRNSSDGGGQATELVNWWSLLNLAGPRYATRNAFEDIGLYALTGGYLMDFVKGAAAAKGIREARGLKPGILARTRRKIGGEAKPGDEDYSIWENVFKPQLNRQEVAEAKAAAAEGDLVKLRQLALKATVRLEAGRLLSPDEERYLVDFISSNASFAKLDEVSQTTYYAASGVQPGVDVSVIPVGGMTVGEGVVVYPRGEYTNILMSADAGQRLDAARFIYWHRNIRNTILADGTLGKIAVANLDNPEEATRLIAQELAKPSSLEYKQRLAAFYDVRVNVSDDEFARRYIQDVYNTFSRADGSLNTNLWRKFISESSDGNRIVRFTKMVDGKKQPVVTVDDLRKMNGEDMPKYVLGRETSREAIAVNMGVDDKIWSVLGNMVARISKEPIFMANYFRARKQLAGYEARLIEEIGPDLARDTVTRHAVDRATTISFSYTDNPANQTILAWRLRNWARYYRATEDFYRRVYRMGKFEPIGFYKAALTLNALEDQGFVYNDDYGDKYFIYPGDGLVNTAIHRVASFFGNNDSMMFGTTPLIFGGKVKMLAPSLDPKAAIPTLSGPISSISFKLLASVVPALQPMEKYVLGEYSIGKTIAETSLSSSVIRFLAIMDRNERDSIFASSYMSAIKILTAAGKMPELSEGNRDKAQQDISRLTTTVIMTRFAAGFIYQASPQIMENDVTWFARQYGTPSMSSDYIGRVKKFREAGETDPYGMALQEGVSLFGPSYAAFSESESERGEGLKSLPELNYTEETLKFIQDNENLISKYPASSQFLAPQADGELSIPAIKYYADQNIRVPRSYITYAEDIAYAEGKFYYYQIMRDYRAAVDAAENAGEVGKAESAKKVAMTNLYKDYPGLQEKIKDSMDISDWENQALNRDNPESVRRMVEDYYAGKFGPIPNSVKYIAESLSTYDYFTTEMNKISGSSAPEKTAKNTYKGALLKSLQDIAKDDVNAEMFIRRVLYPILDADREGNVE